MSLEREESKMARKNRKKQMYDEVMGDIAAKQDVRTRFMADQNKSVDFAERSILTDFHREGNPAWRPFELSKQIDARLTAIGDAFKPIDNTKKQMFYKLPRDPAAAAKQLDDTIEDD